eukprot:jgi/Ulvmu1/6610/UM003_0247.1
MTATHKVTVRFKAVGGAAELSDDKLKVKCNPSDTLQRVHEWLSARYQQASKTPPRHALCLYVKSSFMPALEEQVGALSQAYGVTTRAGGPPELVLEYCDQPNWGPHYFKAN